MIDWKKKLTSRKFWATVCNFVGMLILAFGGNQETAVRVTEIIMAGAGVVAYIIAEGLVDAAGATPETTYHASGDSYLNGEKISVDRFPDCQETD